MRVALQGGAYKTRSIIAGAQRCVNLLAERNLGASETATVYGLTGPLGTPPVPITYYPRPGLVSMATPTGFEWRCLYTASNGKLYGVLDSTVYRIDLIGGLPFLTSLGTITSVAGIVSMADNTLVILIVDGSANGWYIDLQNSDAFGTIGSQGGAFYGADLVDYIDTFFIFNRPGTNEFYISIAEINSTSLKTGPILTGNITPGSGYSNGLHTNVALSGGSGTGATADITVAGGIVTGVTLDVGGQNYNIGDTLSATATQLGGGVTAGTITAGGTKYASGSYTLVPLTGGTGSGAVASITVTAGVVTAVTITTPGIGYAVNDALGVAQSSLGGVGGGLIYTVNTVNNTGSGFVWTISGAGSSAFDPLDVAAKTGAQDLVCGLVALKDEIWVIGGGTSAGQGTTEIWFNAGAADFTFQRVPQALIEHGCCAPHSIAKADIACFFLSQDKQGQGIVFMGSNYSVQRISQHAIENEWSEYPTLTDAVGFTYQFEGHVLYQITFPTANKTWVFDLSTNEWHEETWTDTAGNENRSRVNCHAFAYGLHWVGDWANGTLYQLDADTYDDAGNQIVYRRGFPHLINDGKRISYQRFVADVDVGTVDPVPLVSAQDILLLSDGESFLLLSDGTSDLVLAAQPISTGSSLLSLRYSATKGASWGNPVSMPVGTEGQYSTQVQFRQIGIARDMVFEVFWSYNSLSALNGAFIDAIPCKT